MKQPDETSFPPVAGVTHRFVDIGGVRLHVAEIGQGDPLVLLHGWPQHWYMWRDLLPALAAQYRVLCLDMRGFGWSEAPRSGYGTDQMVADLLALLDALDLRRVRLMGHDWGGWFGFLLCLRYPERVQQFVALNIPHPWQRIDWPMLRALWRFWYQGVIAAPLLGGWLLVHQPGFVRSVILRRGLANKQACAETELTLYAERLQIPARARASVQLYRRFLLREFVPVAFGRYQSVSLRVPTLLLFGSHDIFISPRLLRGFQVHTDMLAVELVPQSGHFIVQECPTLVLERARAFFTG